MSFEPLRLAAGYNALDLLMPVQPDHTHRAFAEARDPCAFERLTTASHDIDRAAAYGDLRQLLHSHGSYDGNAVRTEISNQALSSGARDRHPLRHFSNTDIADVAARFCINDRNVAIFFVSYPRMAAVLGEHNVRRSASGRNLC